MKSVGNIKAVLEYIFSNGLFDWMNIGSINHSLNEFKYLLIVEQYNSRYTTSVRGIMKNPRNEKLWKKQRN